MAIGAAVCAAEGPIEYGVPQVADRVEPVVSRVRARVAGRTAELEGLAIEMFGRGLSTRDIEATFRVDSRASVLSRTAVSQVTERLRPEYEAFATRDLSEFAVAYFFVDGVAKRLHAGMPREAVRCAWGITEDGRQGLLHLAPGTTEDTASCTAFFEDVKRRGLPAPLLAVTDGAPGLIRAVETCFPRALRQRCLVHRLRNLRSKASETQWPEIAIRTRACYEAASSALATLLRDDFVQAYERELLALVPCFLADCDACIAHLRFPLRHRKVIRTTDESVKWQWQTAARGDRLGVGTGDPDRSVGHEATNPTAQVALRRISRAPLWRHPCSIVCSPPVRCQIQRERRRNRGPYLPHDRRSSASPYGDIPRKPGDASSSDASPWTSPRSSGVVADANERRVFGTPARPALRSLALDRVAPSGCTRA